MTPPRPLVVIGLGGNAISPPRGALAIGAERAVVSAAAAELASLIRGGVRLLVVHGNGPQVGRLLSAPGLGDPDNLDVHVAQTQGELGYLLAEAVDAELGTDACVAVVTRAIVDADDPAFACPTKPVGAVLPAAPAGVPSVRTPDGSGWRRVVASPRPHAVVELPAIATLLRTHHVIAGGGGGVPLRATGPRRVPCAAVIDKDWIAALLAVALDADTLVFITDVSHAFDRFGHESQEPIAAMSVSDARRRLADGVFAPGSMRPKVESALQFVSATGRAATIATVGHMDAALRGAAGTTIGPC